MGAFGFGTCWLIQALSDLPSFASFALFVLPEAQTPGPVVLELSLWLRKLKPSVVIADQRDSQQMRVVISLMTCLLGSRREPTSTSSYLGPDTVLEAFLSLVGEAMRLPETPKPDINIRRNTNACKAHSKCSIHLSHCHCYNYPQAQYTVDTIWGLVRW